MNFEELIGLKYGSKTLLRSNVKFVDSNGRIFEGNIYSGVRGEKINKSLFTVSINGRFDFDLVKVSPSIKFGTKKYSKGALVTTHNGSNLFIPMSTLKVIEKKAKKNSSKLVKIYYSNGTNITTKVNSNLSNSEIKDYFKIGKKVNIGSSKDLIVTIKKVEIL